MSEEKKTILVVEDEGDVIAYLKTLFEDHGYNVLTCGTGGEAIRLTREQRPDLISLDITMPEESGSRAYKEIRQDESTKDIPIIIVTGYDDPNFKQFIHTRRTVPPPDGYFDKPIDREALLAKVKELIGE